MRILFLTPQLPFPPIQGTSMRNWGLLSGVARHHEVWLLSFDERTPAAPIPEPLLRACQQVATFPVPRRSTTDRLRMLAASRLPDMAWRLWSPDYAARLGEWVGSTDFDIIQVEGIELARYVLPESGCLPAEVTAGVVFDDHNCEYLLQRRAFETDSRNPRRAHAAAYSFVQSRRLRAFERDACLAAHAVLAVSPQDAGHLRALDPAIRPRVVFNGIDVRSYSPAALGSAPMQPPGPPAVVFTGKMDFRPNVDAMLWFWENVFPRVKKAVPATRLWVVGQKPHARLDPLRGDPNVTLTGAVDDVRPYILRADAYIAPLRVGGGTRFKLLEAMSMRKAIVSTSLGCEGFEVTSGDQLVIADGPEDFAAAVVRVLKDPPLRARLGDSAHAFVQRDYDWSSIVPRLEETYAEFRPGSVKAPDEGA